MTSSQKKPHQKFLVAFIDVLGFKEHLEEYFVKKNFDILEHLESSLQEAKTFALEYGENVGKEYDLEIKYKIFSDCVSIAVALQKTKKKQDITYSMFIMMIKSYQHILLEKKILIRGAICIGGHIENEHMIFSEGLAKAYLLESKKAIYPRILIDHKVLENIGNAPNLIGDRHFHQFIGQYILKDWDEQVFLSPFGILSSVNSAKDLIGEENFLALLPEYHGLTEDQKKDFKAFLNNKDFILAEEYMTKVEILNWVRGYIEKNSKKTHDILIKYHWLKEFVTWSIQKDASRIRFEPYYKPELIMG